MSCDCPQVSQTTDRTDAVARTSKRRCASSAATQCKLRFEFVNATGSDLSPGLGPSNRDVELFTRLDAVDLGNMRFAARLRHSKGGTALIRRYFLLRCGGGRCRRARRADAFDPLAQPL